jgi:hypothetical protein
MADLDILNYALTLEHLEDMMYQQAVAGGALSGRALQLAQEFGAAEHQHVVTLTSVISQLGGTPVAARASYNFPAFSDQASTLSFLITIEDTGVGAYLGQVANIQSGALLGAAASILPVEALHTAALRTLVGMPANPNGAFEKPLAMQTVLAAAGPLLGPAAPTTAQVPAAADDPVSHAADDRGRALWAMQHGGDPSGYDAIDRMDQVTWNSVAIHGH